MYWRIVANDVTIVAVWVDDLFCLVSSDALWKKVVVGVGERLSLVDKGDVVDFLGMSFVRSPDSFVISVSQSVSIGNLLERAGMGDCHPAVTPCVAGIVFTKADCPLVPDARPAGMPNFRGLIALANYIAVWTRPDIVWIVNKLCKFMSNPGPPHVAALKRLLRFLSGTKDVGLVFKKSISQPLLKGFTDSSHADCVDSSKSTIAYNLFMWGNPVSWFSHLDCKIYTCTNHAEYCALFTGAKEAVYLSDWILPLIHVLSVLLGLPRLSVRPVPLLVDNHGAFALSLDPVGRFVNKHVRIEHHFTQQLVADGIVTPVECDTCDNIADIGTKALGQIVFAKHSSFLVGKVLRFDSVVPRVFMFGTQCSLPSVSSYSQTVSSDDCICVGPLVSRCFRPVPLCVSFISFDSASLVSSVTLGLSVSVASLSSQSVSDASLSSQFVSDASLSSQFVSDASIGSQIVPSPGALIFPFVREVHVDSVNNVFSISPIVPVPALHDFPLVTEVLRHFRGCDAVSAVFESRCCEVLSEGAAASLHVDGVVAGIAISAMRASFAAQVVSMCVHPFLPALPIIIPDIPDVLRASPVGFRRRRRRIVPQHRFHFYRGSGPLRFSRRLVGRGPLHRRA